MRGPKTFREICKAVEQERDLKNAKSSVLNALRVMVRSGEVVGEINAETLDKTGGKLAPLYRHTGNTLVYHGGACKDAPRDGSDYSIVRVYKDDKGNLIAKQYFKKTKRKYGNGYTYRAISEVLPVD